MLVGLLLLFISVPLIQSYRGDVALALMYVVLTVTLAISVWSLAGSPSSFRIGLFFVILSVVLAAIDLYLRYSGMGYLVVTLHLLFWTIGARVAARALLAGGHEGRLPGRRRLDPAVQVVWTSGYPEAELALSDPAAALPFVQKPYRAAILCEALSRAVESRRTPAG